MTTVVAFAPDGRLATAGADGLVRFWNPQTADPDGPDLRPGGVVWGVGFTPDGGRAVVTTTEIRSSVVRASSSSPRSLCIEPICVQASA